MKLMFQLQDLNPFGYFWQWLVCGSLNCFKWMSKTAFLNEILNEEVYVEKPKGFQDHSTLIMFIFLKKPFMPKAIS